VAFRSNLAQDAAMSTPRIRSAGPDDREAVIGVITLAFAADPMARWATPDPARYLATMAAITEAFGGNGFAHGSVYVDEAGGGAAMWLPPGVEPDGERLAALIGENAPRDREEDLGAVMDEMGRFHPHEPHWYLPLIGVDPALQGRGIGGALMAHALARVDADGLPAYLESSNPRNITLYRRHSFEAIGSIQHGSSPTLVPMLRPPRGSGARR
jgi:ribosomal protein S18 acetylase RimI-like enzyme